MPDIVNPALDFNVDLPDIDVPIDFPKWDRPVITKPDILKQGQEAFDKYPGQDIPAQDFAKIVNELLTPQQLKANVEDQKLMQSLIPDVKIDSAKQSFRYFSTKDAFRYTQNERLWEKVGYNPELPHDIMDATYDHNESTWESIKNVFPKMWATASFQFKNYFSEYADVAEAIGKADFNVLHNQQRFKDYARDLADMEDRYPDYKSDRETRWWQLYRGDFWEESGSSLGFTLGTIGAALLENVAITAATGGIGEVGELFNTPRKMFKSIADYYSLKRAYGLVRGLVGAKNVVGKLGNAANIWRLTNGALSEASFEGFTAKDEYEKSFVSNYIQRTGLAPDETTMQQAREAGARMANATVLWQTPFLMASNAAQFGNIIAPKSLGKLLQSSNFRFFVDDAFKVGVEATERTIKSPLLRGAAKAGGFLRNGIWEGTEESYQALVSKTATDYYNDQIFNKDDQDIMKSLGVGFDYVTSNTGMKEFAAGFATGSIFKLAGKPFQFIAKPKMITNDKGEVEYKFNWLNKMGIGTEKAAKEQQRMNYQKIADRLNVTDIEAVLKEEGFLNLIRDKRSALALAKYVDNNDLFNMQNVQNLQLNRLLYSGLVNGKLDLQISKLAQFAQQDFDTLKDFFNLDENEYSTPEEQEQFLNNFRDFASSLGAKTKEFESIYEQEKDRNKEILEDMVTDYHRTIDEQNSILEDLFTKYNVKDEAELANVQVDSADVARYDQAKMNAIGASFNFHAQNEALKASVFSQAGMLDDARWARRVIDRLKSNNTTNVQYEELSNIYDKEYRDRRLQDLILKLDIVPDAEKAIVQEQLDTFKELSEYLDDNFETGNSYDVNKVSDIIQRYLYSIEREVNKILNNTSLDTRIQTERSGQLDLIKEFASVQKHQQENLNLYNYLTAGNNTQKFANFQSQILTEFFQSAADLAYDQQVKSAPQAQPQPAPVTPAPAPVVPQPQPQPAPQPAQPVQQNPQPQPQPQAQPTGKLKVGQVKTMVRDLGTAIKNKDYEKRNNISARLAGQDPSMVMQGRDTLANGQYFKDVMTDIDAEIAKIVGQQFFDSWVNKAPASQPEVTPVSTEPVETQTPAQPELTDPLADIERRRQEELSKLETRTQKATDKKSRGSRKGLNVGDKFTTGNRAIVESTTIPYATLTKEEFDKLSEAEKEEYQNNPYEIVTEVLIDSEYDSEGKLSKAPTVRTAAFKNKEQADKYLQEEQERLKQLYNKALDKINAKYDAEIAALNQPEETTPQLSEEDKKFLEDLFDIGTLPASYREIYDRDPMGFVKFVAQQGNNRDENGDINATFDSRLAAISSFTLPVIELADKYFPELVNNEPLPQPDEEEEEAPIEPTVPLEPVPMTEVPPAEPNGSFVEGIDVPKGLNIISVLVDTARKNGEFIFDSVNPKEAEMEAARPKLKDGKIVLKTASDPMLLRHHNVIDHLGKIFARENVTETEKYKIKLEFVNDENKEWFYQRDEKTKSVIAVVVNDVGDYLYFDKEGQPTTEDLGYPFGVEYEFDFYLPEKLDISRNSLAAGSPVTAIKSNYGKTEAPLGTIYTLLQNKVPVMGSILGITSGTLATLNNNNTLATRQKEESEYRMRSVKELFESGDVQEQFIDVKVDGFYIYDFPDQESEQRVKVGRPTLYDLNTGLYIPLTGKKLKDVTFDGNPVPKSSQLYEVIDTLDKQGVVGLDTKRDDIPIIQSEEDLQQTFRFLRETLYSQNFRIFMSDDGRSIRLDRNSDNIRANSIWDAEINYVAKKDLLTSFLDIPLARDVDEQGEPAQTNISYSDFLNENFFSGAAPAIITPKDVRFTKINKRMIFQLDLNHEAMLKEIGTTVGNPTSASSVEPGDWFVSKSDPSIRFRVERIEDDTAYIVEQGTEDEKPISVKSLKSKWLKIEKIEEPKVEITLAQQDAMSRIEKVVHTKGQGNQRTIAGKKYKYSVTRVINPFKTETKGRATGSTIMGTVVDHIAKNVFSNKSVKYSDNISMEITSGKVSAPIGTYFISNDHFKATVEAIEKVKRDLDSQGYVYRTGVVVYDAEADISGEIDLLLIDPQGNAQVADFKTSTSDFDESYFDRRFDNISNAEYFSTQGHIYSMMLAKQANVNVLGGIKIIGLPIAFNTAESLVDTKLSGIRNARQYIHNFTSAQIVPYYQGKTSVKDIVAEYEKLSNQNATQPTSGRQKKEGGLLRAADINAIAATRPELQAELDHMRDMLGDSFVVKFANFMNEQAQARWYPNGTILYKNAAAGSVYHEGWHQFSQLFLTVDEKLKMYQSLRNQGIKGDDLEIEEFLAEEWVKYVKNPSQYKFPKPEVKGIIGFFKNLWNLLKEWFSGTKNPVDLFRDLHQGRYAQTTPDINNAIWGKLNSPVLDNTGKEILNHTRTGLYINTTSYFIGELLRRNRLSFTWLVENMKSDRIKINIFNEFDQLQLDILNKMYIPSDNKRQYLYENTEAVIDATVKSKGIKREQVEQWINQINEIEGILDEDNGGFDNFFNYYLRNSDIDVIRDNAENSEDVTNVFDNEEIREIEEEYNTDATVNGEEIDEDEETLANTGSEYGKGPNDESAFSKASKEIKDFFRTMPMISGINNDGTSVFTMNELGVPQTYDYASVFNKTKSLLAGKFTIESVMARLNDPYIRKIFPQTKYIHDELDKYIKEQKNENFAFLQKFVRIMSLPEVDNRKLRVDYSAVEDRNIGNQRTAIVMRSMSRVGEASEIGQWKYNFTRPEEWRPVSKVTDDISISKLYNDKDYGNILYNVEGVVVLNPFYDYANLKVSSKKFLEIMGIRLNDRFWENPDLIRFADLFQSLALKNLIAYKGYVEYQIAQSLTKKQTMDDVRNNNSPNRAAVESLIKEMFIPNPLELFSERKSWKMGDKLMETRSLYTLMEDLSRQNSVFSPESTSRSFSDGSGKLKYPFYEPSLLAYRTQILNNIQKISDFDTDIEYSFMNPNTMPWLRNSLFYKEQFDSRGNRKVISSDVREDAEGERVKIQIADLSSFETVQDRKYTTVHPKSLSAQDKLFFDTLTLFTDGFIEIPRAATSSTVMAVKLNSYGAVAQGKQAISKPLPIVMTDATTGMNRATGKLQVNYGQRFHVIMNNYLMSELHKMRWYHEQNPQNEFANRFNIFEDILPVEMKTEMSKDIKAMTFRNQEDLAKKIADYVNSKAADLKPIINSYFSDYAKELYNGKNSSYQAMSQSQKKIIRSITNLYNDRSKSQDKSDVTLQQQIAQTVSQQESTSAYQTAKEKAGQPIDSSLAIVAGIFAANQFILNAEYHIWYMGDNYLFGNPFKRGNLTTNTGTLGITSGYTNTMLNQIKGETMHSLLTGNTEPKDFRKLKTFVGKEVETKSRYIDIMVNDRIAFETQYNILKGDPNERRKELIEELGAYNKIKSADGQAKISLDAYRIMRIVYGNWSFGKDEKEYQRQIAIMRKRLNIYKNEGQRKIDDDLIKGGPYSSFNPQKFAYTGPELVMDEKGNQIPSPMRTKFDKMSLHPLIPEMLLGTGYSDEKLMMEMAVQDADYFKMESASKGAKHGSISDFYDSYGNANPNVKLEEASPEWLLSSYLKHQLNTDSFKPENTFGSQQRVMFFDIKYQPAVQNNPKELAKLEKLEQEYLQHIQNIMDFQKAQFLNRYGLVEKGQGQSYDMEITDKRRFAAAINSIAKRNNFPSNMMDYLQYDENNQKYKYDPSLLFNRKMLMDSIGGEIDSELRRLKTKGTAAIQVTSVGNTSPGITYTNPTEEQIKQYGTNGLHYYHYIYDKAGNIVKTSTMGIKITLQGDFKNLLQLQWNGNKIGNIDTLNSALKDENFREKNQDKLTIIGYRIPTNNNNFIDHAEIMEFLPESAGNIIIAPMEHIIKSGSDFDVDKMNFVFPSIQQDGKLAELPSRTLDQLYEKINSITNSVKDYKNTQKEIKALLKAEKRDYKRISAIRDKIELLIRDEFFAFDANLYSGQVQADKSFPELIDFFEPYFMDNENIQRHIANYQRVQDALQGTVSEEKVNHEFHTLLQEIGRYKDYHTNQMLDTMKRALTHPAALGPMTTPSNADYLLSEADRIAGLTGRTVNDDLSSSENMKYTTVNQRHKEYLSDSKDLGLYSIQRRWFSLLNYSKMELNRNWQYQTASENYDLRIYTPLAKPELREELGDFETIRVHGDNLDKKSVKDIWDQLMTLTIDLPSNSKYTLFGINKHNRKVAQYLILSRYGVGDMLDFINQPALQEVYKQFENKSKEMKGYMLKHALLEVAKTYGINEGGFKELYETMYDKQVETEMIIGANVFVRNPGIAANKLLNEELYFDPEVMRNDIKNPDKKSKEFKERQKQVLLYFMSVALEATNFTGMQFAFSEDRNKNTNYFTILENDRKKEAIRGEEFSDLPVSGSMFSKTALDKLEKSSIYTPFSYGAVAKLFYEQFATEFTDPVVAHAITRILNNTNTFGINRQLLANRIEGDFIEFIYKNFGKMDINIYDPFSDTMAKNKVRFSFHFLSNIFNMKGEEDFKTYQAKLVKFLDRYPELRDITFVQKLYGEGIRSRDSKNNSEVSGMDRMSASVIRFRRSQENTIQERNFYTNQLQNLINFDPTAFRITRQYSTDDMNKISAFFTELSYLTLYQAGPTNIADNFSDLLPADLWQPFAADAFERYRKAIADKKVRHGDLMKMFSMMYTENNPKVAWKDDRMYYSLSYYGENLKKSERKAASKFRANTEYFLNFRAGKMYDLEIFANKLDFKGIPDLNNC